MTALLLQSKLARGAALVALFVAAIAIVWHPVVFGGYTISDNVYARTDAPPYGADVQPVIDPAAGACQDEPWLALIGRSLAQGDVPLVNMRNGLGAPLAESLQPGVFYPLNLLLVLLDRTSSAFFDVFELLHVLIYALGLYALLRHYARPSTAVCIALLVALSGITSQHVNMVHFRTHAWMPWMTCAAVAIARGDRGKRSFALLVTSHVCAVTCGALQEAFVSSLAVGAIFAIEWWTSARLRVRRMEGAGDVARFGVALACSTAIAAVAFLPYMVTRGSGDIHTAVNPARVLEALPSFALANWVVPGATGFFPHLFTPSAPQRWMSDFSTIGVFVCSAGAIAMFFDRGAQDRRRFALFGLLLVLGLAKLQGLFVFDLLRFVPFLNEILVAKYHAWIFDVTAIVAAIGLEALLRADMRALRRSVVAGFVVVAGAALLLLGLTWRTHPSELFAKLPPDVSAVAMWTYGGSGAALLVGAVLLFTRPRGIALWLGALVVAQAVVVRPDGWKPGRETYASPLEEPAIAQPNGEAPPRVLSLTRPNQNLIHDFESVGVFDPVNSIRLYGLLGRAFELENPGFILAPKAHIAPLGTRSIQLLRLLGVERMYDIEVVDPESHAYGVDGALLVAEPLPRVWCLSRDEARSFEDQLSIANLFERIEPLRAAVGREPAATDVRVLTNGLEFRAARDFSGVLVAHQIFMHAWELDGHPSRPFMQAFPAWDVELVAGRTYRIAYVPLGLRAARWISAAGVLLALAVAFVGSKRSVRDQPPVERAASV